MATVYVRDVPADVVEALKARAASEGRSLSALVGAELVRIAARPTNAQLVARLRERDRSVGPSTAEILTELEAGRR
ncbi:FitA-like ribbon-helix-helix domain-containing protein [Demequina pelophila]|uniref:FitA-like ribbon-helix-helix domain-containing protein n=1 Tax=Demequina pelophila TaxID=1638984 RepID=UPI00078400B1|nr:hypothetical protein [Demequina pelophila]